MNQYLNCITALPDTSQCTDRPTPSGPYPPAAGTWRPAYWLPTRTAWDDPSGDRVAAIRPGHYCTSRRRWRQHRCSDLRTDLVGACNLQMWLTHLRQNAMRLPTIRMLVTTTTSRRMGSLVVIFGRVVANRMSSAIYNHASCALSQCGRWDVCLLFAKCEDFGRLQVFWVGMLFSAVGWANTFQYLDEAFVFVFVEPPCVRQSVQIHSILTQQTYEHSCAIQIEFGRALNGQYVRHHDRHKVIAQCCVWFGLPSSQLVHRKYGRSDCLWGKFKLKTRMLLCNKTYALNGLSVCRTWALSWLNNSACTNMWPNAICKSVFVICFRTFVRTYFVCSLGSCIKHTERIYVDKELWPYVCTVSIKSNH